MKIETTAYSMRRVALFLMRVAKKWCHDSVRCGGSREGFSPEKCYY
jgi:hypothetical protein